MPGKNGKGETLKALTTTISVVALFMVAYHLVMTQYLLENPMLWQNTHLGFGLVLSFMVSMRKQEKKWWPFSIALILMSLISTIYVKFHFERLQYYQGWPTSVDVIIGILLIIAVIEGARRMQGTIFPILSLIFLLYAFLGQYLPQPLWHEPFHAGRVIAWLTVSFGGIYGKLLTVSAKYIYLFMLFGGLLQASKTSECFVPLARAIGKKFAGGGGHTAILSSALVGTVTGVGLANVAITGSFTIPMMKKLGYRPEQAAAIEATASIGGQFMPPVMGAAAFLMVAFTGNPYVKIMAAGLIPSILYFYSVAVGVQLLAMKQGLEAPKEEINWKIIALRAPVFLVSIGLLSFFLIRGNSPMFAAFYAVVSVPVVSSIMGFFWEEIRITPSEFLKGFISGSTAGARIASGIGCLGIVVGVVLFSGLGPKFGLLIEMLSGGMVAPALILTMILCIILGMGMPITAAYILVAVVAVPGLVQIGVDLLSAHFFAFYYAVLGAITPPVAGACIVAAPMAGASYMRTSVRATGLAIAGIIVPFFFVWNPALLLYPSSLWALITTLASAAVTILCLQILFTNYFLLKPTAAVKILVLLAIAAFFGHQFWHSIMSFIVGLVLFAFLIAVQLRSKRRLFASTF